MPAVCFYFQVHQPYRLRRYSYFDIGGRHDYFDDELNKAMLQRVAARCYIPANKVLLELIREHKGAFKVAFSITGTAIEQMKAYAPEALESFRELADTGCVEFLGETYYHSLASLYDFREWAAQVALHSDCIEREFGFRPTVFRNTELLYSDDIGAAAGELGFKAVLAEGVDDVLGWRSPNFMYRVPGKGIKLLLKNYKLSDDIAFRFSANGDFLSPKAYASWIHELSGNADVVGLFLDYETFGEHYREESGIFTFLKNLPAAIVANQDWRFSTPTEVTERLSAVGELSFSRLTSWADTRRDESAWAGNEMQKKSLARIYDTATLFEGRYIQDEAMTSARETWRRLQTSDHYYYMCTKGYGDGVVHQYFSPFESPYDAFIAYSNVVKDFAAECARAPSTPTLRLVSAERRDQL